MSPSFCQCLFCNHLNPVGASFCNECGSQLQLQQCDLCGSINKRSARVCYKCGTAFCAPSSHANHHAALEHHYAGAAFGPDVIEHETTSLPESAVRALGARRDGGYARAVTTAPGLVPHAGVAADSSLAALAAAQSALAPPLASVAATRAESGFIDRHPLALVMLVMVFVVVSAYLLRSPFAVDARRLAGDADGDPLAASVHPLFAAPGGAAANAADIAPGPAASRLPSVDERAAMAVVRRPASERDGAAMPATQGKDCPEAVAALGLCEVPTNRE